MIALYVPVIFKHLLKRKEKSIWLTHLSLNHDIFIRDSVKEEREKQKKNKWALFNQERMINKDCFITSEMIIKGIVEVLKVTNSIASLERDYQRVI